MFGALFAFDPKLAAWLFIFRLDCLFLLVDGIHGCQTSSQLSGCGDFSIGVFASARRNWGSGGFVFCFWWQMPRGPPRVLCVPRGRKSNQFSLVPNRKYFPTRCAMAVARRTLCSAWFLHRSFYLWAKPEEGDLFWIYALDSERVFACVAQSSCRGVLPDFDSNFLWMMVDWVSRFPRLTLAKQEPGEEAKTGRQWDEGAGRPQ